MLNSWTKRLAVGLGAAAVALTVSATPAEASKTGNPSAGHSSFSLTNQVASKIIGGCAGDSTVFVNTVGTATETFGKNGVKFRLPVTGLVTTDSGNIRIEHAGSGFELFNSCYDITFTNFYIQDLGDGTSDSGFDVLARNLNDTDEDGTPRVEDFSLDLSDANTTITGSTTKIRSANLLLSDQGAVEFNELAGDPTGASGPFSSGDQIGKAQSFYRNPPAA